MRSRVGVLAVLLSLPLTAVAGEKKALDPAIESLDYGETLYQFYQGRYFTAITHLRAAQAKQVLGEDAEQGEMLLGGLYLGYGMHDEAERLFQRLLARSARPEVQDRAWFWLGKVRYRRGLTREALAAFARVGDTLPNDLAAEKRVMEGLILMQQKAYAQAAEVLMVTEEEGGAAWSAYAQFNRAAALLRTGRSVEGEALFAALGSMRAEGEEQKSLRDRANFALGMHLLNEGRDAEAKAALQRVRLQALQSSQALLAAGWSDARGERFDAALVPWMRLEQRPLHEPAVADALLAVPYALSRLEDHAGALDHYRKAEGALIEELGLLRNLGERIEGGHLLKSVYVVTEEIRQSEASEFLNLDEGERYLGPLLANNRFREALRDYLDLAFLKQHLARRGQSLDAFDAMLETRRVAYERRLPRVQALEADTRRQALLAQRDVLQRRFDAVEGDALALATDGEQAQLRRLESLRKRLQRLAGHPQQASLLARQRLLEGLLVWWVESEYPARSWALRKEMRTIDDALKSVGTRQAAILRVQRRTPVDFSDFERRIAAARREVARLAPRVAAALERQGEQLERLASAFLEERRKRLQAHLVQARFAMAQIYDQAAVGATESSE